MLSVESYIIKNKAFVINDIDKINTDLFVNIKDCKALDKTKLDYDYINGAIVIVYNEKHLLGFKEWDLVDQLWYYFIEAMIKLKTESTVEFTFPDQPLPVRIEKKGNEYLIIHVNNNTSNINYVDFITNMYMAARIFFDNLLEIFPENKFDIQLSIDKVNELQNVYKL